MAGLSADKKDRISAALDATSYKQRRFSVTYDDENNPVATIMLLSSPEYRFLIRSAENGAFVTNECPGVHSDKAEAFPRNDFDLCIRQSNLCQPRPMSPDRGPQVAPPCSARIG